jgi:hypothetical protein
VTFRTRELVVTVQDLAVVVVIVSALAVPACGSSQRSGDDGSSNFLTFTNDTGRDVELSRCSPQACNSPVWTAVLDAGSSKDHVRVSNRGGFAAFLVRAHVAQAPGEGYPIGCFEFRFRKPVENEIRVRISEAGPC